MDQSLFLNGSLSFEKEGQPLYSPYQTKKTFQKLSKLYSDYYVLLGCEKQDKLVFTNSKQEAISQVFWSHYRSEVYESGKAHFLTPNIDEYSIFSSIESLELFGCVHEKFELSKNAQALPSVIEEAIHPMTTLISLSFASPLTGVIHPIYEISKICRSKGIKLHVDISQIFGRLYFKFEDFEIDYVTMGLETKNGPMGVVMAKENIKLASLVNGATEQKYRGGSFEIPKLENGLELLIKKEKSFESLALEQSLIKSQFEKKLKESIPKAEVLFTEVDRLFNTCTVFLPQIRNELMAYYLAEKNIFVALGGGDVPKIERQLTLLGEDKQKAHCCFSLILPDSFTKKMSDDLLEAIVGISNKLSSVSAGC